MSIGEGLLKQYENRPDNPIDAKIAKMVFDIVDIFQDRAGFELFWNKIGKEHRQEILEILAEKIGEMDIE